MAALLARNPLEGVRRISVCVLDGDTVRGEVEDLAAGVGGAAVCGKVGGLLGLALAGPRVHRAMFAMGTSVPYL